MFVKNSQAHLCCLDDHIAIPPSGKYMKFIHRYQSPYRIQLFLVLEMSFVQKVALFTLSSKYLPLYFMFAWFNFVMSSFCLNLHMNFVLFTIYQKINMAKVYRVFTSDSFFVTKKQEKSRHVFMKFSSTTNVIVWKCLSPCISKSICPFSAVTCFSKIFSTSRINKIVNKHFWVTYKYFRFNLRDKSSHIPRNSLWFYLSSECLLNFLSNL